MKLSYNGLWKILIDQNMNKTDLKNKLKLSPSTVSKMTKGENVSLEIIKKIAIEFNVDIGDIVSLDR
ncbi:helix-turn-helix transcriptional regulator [Criibacterium bergeronii]|uniref:Helix-turn-helix transcriptional regulator n=1 Tax=Criibacterium bergeronii TaxID=1871336 RepID=A0A552V6Q8_9FIRM|nr:helix-turn-helix transcriptional regulator [Criibacterium bergeronii]TRW26153.1 helix-turn-helix transcriptional regulator [Criibacterium bergeronii]